ncbi:solute carrier family 12 member 3-like [Salmo trutta]|uniref:solute carrier family 12 member 3-like n=1 Tax=Salmo trutta TaxID=8032 RepID=UPI001130E203|nr:solute carrier family 12 member 3-like [Salmo trutta]
MVTEPQPHTVFQSKQGENTIDVYWLLDDGGEFLTLLIPYLLTRNKCWVRCEVLVFVGGDILVKGGAKERVIMALVGKFRLGFHDVKVLPDINGRPQHEQYGSLSLTLYCMIMWNTCFGILTVSLFSGYCTSIYVFLLQTFQQIRLNEVLQDYSRDAAMIVITMPVGRRGQYPSALCMAWLETRDSRPLNGEGKPRAYLHLLMSVIPVLTMFNEITQ